MQEVAPEWRLSELANWSVYRSAGLHPRCFAGVDLAVSGWPECLRKAFLACWRPLLECLKRVDGPFWRWPDAACQTRAERLADFVRAHPECLAGLPLPMELFFARLFLLAGQVDLYVRHRSGFVERARTWAGGELACADEMLPAMYRMAWANEQADPRQLGLLIETLRSSLAGQPEAHRGFLHLSHLYRERCQDYELSANATADDASFAECIRDKRIAIVGPVDVGLESGLEIDSFDLVIRPTHRANNVLPHRQFGSRSDIAYYLEDDLSLGLPDNFLPSMRDLRFVVLAESCRQRFPWLSELGERLRTRFEIGIRRNPFLVGYPTAIPRILIDVLRFAPAEVKVFNANLYLGRRYAGNYLQESGEPFSFYPGFTLHDPISNFIFLQRAWQGGWFKVDAVLAGILSLSAQEYQAAFYRVHAGSGMEAP